MVGKKKFGIEFIGFEDVIKDLQKLGQDVKPIAEEALKASHAYVTPKIHERMNKKYMPAKGKYMGKRTVAKEDSQIIDDINIEWKGDIASIDIGFDLDKGIVPIFMIKGTDTMPPVTGLKATMYGKKTEEEIAKIQEDIFFAALRKRNN